MEYKFSIGRCLIRYLAPVLIVQLIGGLFAAYLIKLGFGPINGLSDLQCAIIAIAAIGCILVTPLFLIVTIMIEVLLFRFVKGGRLTDKDGILIYDELSDGVIQGRHNAKERHLVYTISKVASVKATLTSYVVTGDIEMVEVCDGREGTVKKVSKVKVPTVFKGMENIKK